MSDQDYIYGVFADSSNVPAVVGRLHKAGLKTSEICVLGNKSDQFTHIAGKIADPTAKHFVSFGIGGAIAGLIAGICLSLHIPGINGFQLIVPLMGTISGGACFPYFACQLMTFLTSNNPQHWASVFEGSVENGAVIIMAEPQSPQQRQSAIDILLAYSPVELTFRRALWGASLTDQPAAVGISGSDIEHKQPSDGERHLTAVA